MSSSDGSWLRWPTCVLRQAGAVAVALRGGDAVRAHGPPVGGQSSGGGRRLALTRPAQRPLAGVSVPGAVGGLYTLPGHGVWEGIRGQLGVTNTVYPCIDRDES